MSSVKSPVAWKRPGLFLLGVEPGEVDEIEAFLERMESRGCSPHTIRGYRVDLEKARRFIEKSLLMACEQDIEAFIVAETNRGLQSDSIARRVTTLRSFYKDARRHRLIVENPVERITPPKRPKRLARYLKDAERSHLLKNLPCSTRYEKRNTAIVATFCHAGLRLAELTALSVEDIAPDTLLVHGKGRIQRAVPINRQLRGILDSWLAVHPTGKGALFTSLGNTPGRLCNEQVREIVKVVFRGFGWGDRGYTPLTLRHTYATYLVKKGVPLNVVQRLLGHADINTTMTYVHTQFDSKVIDLLDE